LTADEKGGATMLGCPALLLTTGCARANDGTHAVR
jgi:hypothetical protein